MPCPVQVGGGGWSGSGKMIVRRDQSPCKWVDCIGLWQSNFILWISKLKQIWSILSILLPVIGRHFSFKTAEFSNSSISSGILLVFSNWNEILLSNNPGLSRTSSTGSHPSHSIPEYGMLEAAIIAARSAGKLEYWVGVGVSTNEIISRCLYARSAANLNLTMIQFKVKLKLGGVNCYLGLLPYSPVYCHI